MTGSHEVRGSIPLGSTNFHKLVNSSVVEFPIRARAEIARRSRMRIFLDIAIIERL